jgi:hypothetical protein
MPQLDRAILLAGVGLAVYSSWKMLTSVHDWINSVKVPESLVKSFTTPRLAIAALSSQASSPQPSAAALHNNPLVCAQLCLVQSASNSDAVAAAAVTSPPPAPAASRTEDELDVTAATCAVLCQLVYDNAVSVRDGKYAQGMNALLANAKRTDSGWHEKVVDRLKDVVVASDDECTLNATCFSNEDELIIVCKGTVDWKDLWQDIGIFFFNRPWTRAAATIGLVQKWVERHEKDVKDHNEANLNNPKKKKRIILAGHSLGATVAYIVAFHLMLGKCENNFSLHDVHMFNAGRGPFFWNDPIEYDFDAYMTDLSVTAQWPSDSSSPSTSTQPSMLLPTGQLCHHFIDGDMISNWKIPTALQHQTTVTHYNQPTDLKSQGQSTHSLANFHHEQPENLLPQHKT